MSYYDYYYPRMYDYYRDRHDYYRDRYDRWYYQNQIADVQQQLINYGYMRDVFQNNIINQIGSRNNTRRTIRR